MLVLAEAFPEQAPRAAALDSSPDFPARDDAEFWRRAFRQAVPIGDEAALCKTLALLPDPREIAVLSEARGAAQSQAIRVWHPGSGVWGRGGHEHAD